MSRSMTSKGKTKLRSAKKASRSSGAGVKSLRLKAKPAGVAKPSKKPSKVAIKKTSVRRANSDKAATSSKVAPKGNSTASTSPVLRRAPSRDFASAIQAYEAGIKLMHAEQFEKAINKFESLLADHPDEAEIQDRAKVLIHACEKKVQESARTVLRSSEDHYNVGVADLNRRELGSAIQHLQHALKLAPKGDHILYALAAANALQGNREDALGFLKQSIHNRPENRYLAARDSDFESLIEDSDFQQLLASHEK